MTTIDTSNNTRSGAEADGPPRSTFAAYAEAGFGLDLLPILPHDAAIHPDSPMRESLLANRGKVPGERRRGGWVGKRSWPELQATIDDIAAWEASGAGIGMQGRNFPALDIDVDDIELADRVHELAILTLGVAPIRFGRGSRRILVYAGSGFNKRRVSFRCANPAGGAVEIDAIQAVELLATGQQYVVEGIHPKTHLPYRWHEGQSPAVIGAAALSGLRSEALDAFFDKLESLLDMFGYEVTNRSAAKGKGSAVVQAGLLAPSVEAIGRALAAIPNEVDYDTWMKLLAAVKGAAGPEREGDAYALFEDWSLQWPENTPEGVLAKWRSFHPPYQVGWDYLARYAQDEGAGSFFSAHEDFDAIADAPGPDTKSGPLLPPAEQKMFDRYVWVESIQRICDRLTGDLLNREQFNVRLAKIGDPASSKDCAWAVFVRDYVNVTAVKNVTYRPGQGQFVTEALPGLTGQSINTWTDPAVDLPAHASDADIKPWLDHVAMVIPDEFERETVLSWLAWICQNPGEKPNWALVIGSTSEGLGKDLMMDPVRAALGSANVREIGPDDLSSGWTDFIKGTRLLIVEEMELNERKATMNRLKPLRGPALYAPRQHQIPAPIRGAEPRGGRVLHQHAKRAGCKQRRPSLFRDLERREAARGRILRGAGSLVRLRGCGQGRALADGQGRLHLQGKGASARHESQGEHAFGNAVAPG